MGKLVEKKNENTKNEENKMKEAEESQEVYVTIIKIRILCLVCTMDDLPGTKSPPYIVHEKGLRVFGGWIAWDRSKNKVERVDRKLMK